MDGEEKDGGGGELKSYLELKKKKEKEISYFLLAILALHYNHHEINALTSICTIPIFLLPHQF